MALTKVTGEGVGSVDSITVTDGGSIGSDGSDLVIDGPSGHTGLRMTTSGLLPRQNGAIIDNTIDLGSTGYRYNDLYLGGNLYLGGTGSANALSDYEEGTFTPAYTEGLTSVSYQFRGGKYTKVGRLVYFQISIRASAATTNGNQVRISGLPFNSDTSAAAYGGAFITYNNNWYVQLGGPTLFIQENDTHVLFYKKSDGGTLKGNDSDLQELNDIHINGFYMT